ncbi:hypothetical protein [Mycolicibacterium confluentis]|uniref:Uncharacterized protein n=1 Tax=Mycolicibacterium confluentis TaxID=28047 RepID=A0A7I7XW94_9MYCO|nr:hypothetical protein [Mycolicibacterium confluentis]MCV7321748.1 hypothetical protein [Mycolicibacterium confluentis]ORV32023.1 hypothetical protein AWB99_10125 [Mycolicibacterium confluentis]BBZ33559.1 hypothetical protein MCNF_21640 [Mycolicibacterium confluentis]
MIRAFAAAGAAAAAMFATATVAGAEPKFDYADVPNMTYDVQLSTKCYSWERFIFGRGEGGQTYACHYIPNQWPPVDSGFWVWSPPLYGVQEIGAPCPTNRGAAAQTPDGLPLECAGDKGWQQEFYA